jgi:hypothetical protein
MHQCAAACAVLEPEAVRLGCLLDATPNLHGAFQGCPPGDFFDDIPVAHMGTRRPRPAGVPIDVSDDVGEAFATRHRLTVHCARTTTHVDGRPRTRAHRRKALPSPARYRRHRKALRGSARSWKKPSQDVGDSQARTRTKATTGAFRHFELCCYEKVWTPGTAVQSTFEIKTAGAHLEGRPSCVKVTGTVCNFNFSSLEFFRAFNSLLRRLARPPRHSSCRGGPSKCPIFRCFKHFECPAVQSTFAAKHQRASSGKAILAVNFAQPNRAFSDASEGLTQLGVGWCRRSPSSLTWRPLAVFLWRVQAPT